LILFSAIQRVVWLNFQYNLLLVRLSNESEAIRIKFVNLVMVGKQVINNVLEFFTATRRTLTPICCKRDEPGAQEQWEKDNQLFKFDSNTLMSEYLEIGKRSFIE
jgi:hypothetical protein